MDFYQFLAQLLPPPPNYKPCTSPVITHSNENVFYQKLQPPEHQFSSCNRPDKKQGRKSSYSEEQKAILEDCFISSRGYINRETRNKLAAQMNISPQRVSYWFNVVWE
ncbi:hypothetical protein TYRP_000080 [Tyrophagus putrescentiae]|nr:hypothetical protein TYRP_000080 [Tyrophagus putrescentiae]